MRFAGALGEAASADQTAAAVSLLRTFLSDLVQKENDLRLWAGSLGFQVALGVAKCDDLRFYNQKAVTVYQGFWFTLNTLRAAGADQVIPGLPTEPELPPLFGQNLSVFLPSGQPIPTVQIDLTCDQGGLAPPNVRMFAQRPCPMPTSSPPAGLSGPEVGAIAACVGAPWACGTLILLGAGATFLILQGAKNFALAVLQSQGVINAQLQDQTIRAEAQRQAAINECLKLQLPTLSGLPAADLQAGLQRIRDACEKLHPQGERAPFVGSIGSTLIALGLITLVGVGLWKFAGSSSSKKAA
jgi:hypothetical protein